MPICHRVIPNNFRKKRLFALLSLLQCILDAMHGQRRTFWERKISRKRSTKSVSIQNADLTNYRWKSIIFHIIRRERGSRHFRAKKRKKKWSHQ